MASTVCSSVSPSVQNLGRRVGGSKEGMKPRGRAAKGSDHALAQPCPLREGSE